MCVFGLGVHWFAVLDSVFSFAVLATVFAGAVLNIVNWFGVLDTVFGFAVLTQGRVLLVEHSIAVAKSIRQTLF